MIYLWSASPGTGKTCYVVKQLIDKWLDDPKNKGRKIYHNINGLKIEGLHKAPDDFRQCDDGSIIIYDEAQDIEYYSVESKINTVCKELSKHRHRGFDIHFITQDPALLNKWVLKNVYMHYYLWRPAQRKNVEIYTFPRAIVSPTKADFKTAYDKKLWRFEEYYLQFYKSTVLNTSEKVGSTKKNGLLVTGFLLFCVLAYFIKPLFGIGSIFNAGQAQTQAQTEKQTLTPSSIDNKEIVSQAPPEPQKPIDQQLQDQQLGYEQQQFARRIYLYNQDLPQDYVIRRTDPMLQVRGVVQMGNKCQVVNAYGDVMTLTLDHCKQYVGTGRVFNAIGQNQSPPPQTQPTAPQPEPPPPQQPLNQFSSI